MNAEKTFTVNFGSGSVEMNNFGYFEESIFENTFNNLSAEERKVLVDDEEAMLKYIKTGMKPTLPFRFPPKKRSWRRNIFGLQLSSTWLMSVC